MPRLHSALYLHEDKKHHNKRDNNKKRMKTIVFFLVFIFGYIKALGIIVIFFYFTHKKKSIRTHTTHIEIQKRLLKSRGDFRFKSLGILFLFLFWFHTFGFVVFFLF
ncbi:hypothetical protein V6Z11_A06G062600 [Gossypium hirsutum]